MAAMNVFDSAPKGCAPLMVGGLLLMIGGCQSWSDIQMAISGKKAEATIGSLKMLVLTKTRRMSSREVLKPTVSFSFKAEDGRGYRGSVHVPEAWMNAHQTGDKIEVVYKASDPKMSARPADIGGSKGWLFMLLGAGLAAVGLYGFYLDGQKGGN
jgi:hypothetical protein